MRKKQLIECRYEQQKHGTNEQYGSKRITIEKSRLESYDCIYLEYNKKMMKKMSQQHSMRWDWAYGKQKIHELFMEVSCKQVGYFSIFYRLIV